MEKKKRFLGIGIALVFVVGLGQGINANPLGSFVSGWKSVTNDLILEPRWRLSTQVRLKRNSLIRAGEKASSFYTDPLVPVYDTTLGVGDPSGFNFELTHQLTPYTESQTSYRSLGSERLLMRLSYPINPECLFINVETGRDKYRYGAGIDIYDPFLAQTGGGGFKENRVENTDRFGVGFNLSLPSMMRKKFGVQVSIGGQQMSYLYPSSEESPTEGIEEKDRVDNMSMYTNFMSDFIFSPKFKITFSGNLEPDQRIGYYTTGGYAELYYSSQRLQIGSEYSLSPALKVECGYSYNKRKSGRTLGKGAEEFGIPLEERITGLDEFYIKVNVRP